MLPCNSCNPFTPTNDLLGHRAGSILEEAVKQQQHEAVSQEEHQTAAPVSKRPATQALALLSESLMESSLQELN